MVKGCRKRYCLVSVFLEAVPSPLANFNQGGETTVGANVTSIQLEVALPIAMSTIVRGSHASPRTNSPGTMFTSFSVANNGAYINFKTTASTHAAVPVEWLAFGCA